MFLTTPWHKNAVGTKTSLIVAVFKDHELSQNAKQSFGLCGLKG